MTEIWLGYAYRSAARPDDAIGAWRRALEHDPMNLSIYADVAELLADMGRLDDAVSWAEQALRIDPTYDCAVHTAQVLRFRRDGDVDHLVALADFMREHPQESHEHGDLEAACRGYEWLGTVAAPTEACVNVLAHYLRENVEPAGVASLAISDMEPPSATSVVERTLPGLRIAIDRVSEPDPRLPLGPVGIQLWAFDDTRPRPAVRPPSAGARDQIGELAGYRLRHPPAAYDQAVGLAGVPLDDLLGLLVHPPEPADGPLRGYPALWVKCVQAWACLGILHHKPDEPWATSTRRKVLVDIAYGVEDWTTETALYALVVAAWVDPSARADVRDLVAGRFHAAAEAYARRPVTIMPSLAALALTTPQLPADLRELARGYLSADDEEGPGQE
jgi:hypothetical protein